MPVRKIVISNTDGVYECFPCLTLTQSGKLITVYRESDSHTASQYSHLVMRHSTDQGETWSERQVLIESRQRDGVLHKWNCPRIGQLDDGRLWVLCDGYNVPPGEGRTVDSRIHFWLVAAQIGETRHTFLVQFVFRSDDEGGTWQPIVVCDQEGLNPCEASIVQLPDDGTLVCYMRENSGRGWPGPKCLSHDDGRTWEGPYMTDMIGCHRPVAGLLRSGNIMVTHRHTCRGRIGSARNFLAFRESADSARQTDPALGGGIILPLDHDRWDAPDQGYSGWVVLPNDRIVVVNYIRDDGPMAHIRGYFLTEQDF
jgi:hypothetical protein